MKRERRGCSSIHTHRHTHLRRHRYRVVRTECLLCMCSLLYGACFGMPLISLCILRRPFCAVGAFSCRGIVCPFLWLLAFLLDLLCLFRRTRATAMSQMLRARIFFFVRCPLPRLLQSSRSTCLLFYSPHTPLFELIAVSLM